MNFLNETILILKNWCLIFMWTILFANFRILRSTLHIWANDYYFECSGVFLLWFAEISMSESNFPESSLFSCRWLVESSEFCETFLSDFDTSFSRSSPSRFRSRSRFDFSWCEALSLKFPELYYVEISVCACSVKVIRIFFILQLIQHYCNKLT